MVEWDSLSDQPAHMRDKKFKRNIRKRYPGDIIVSAITILIIYPLVFITVPLAKAQTVLID